MSPGEAHVADEKSKDRFTKAAHEPNHKGPGRIAVHHAPTFA
jgi:hypothetical protein